MGHSSPLTPPPLLFLPQESAGSCTACGARTKAPHLESIVQPQHRTGGYTPNPMQIPRYQVGFIQPAAKHIIGFIPHPGKQREVFWKGGETQA